MMSSCKKCREAMMSPHKKCGEGGQYVLSIGNLPVFAVIKKGLPVFVTAEKEGLVKG